MTDEPTTGIPDGITRDDVLQAIDDYDAGTVDHRFRASLLYDLVYDGKRYPPKALVGLAARRLRGRPLEPNEFSAGEDSRCFATLRNLGFVVEKKSPNLPTN